MIIWAHRARFGKSTGIDPSVAWPTQQDIEYQQGYENTLYDDGLDIKQMIHIEEQKIKEKDEEIARTERKIQENLAKQDAKIKEWQKRVEGRNVLAEKQRQKQKQIFAEVKFIVKFFLSEANVPHTYFAKRVLYVIKISF